MGRRDVSIDSRVRCQCSVPVGTDAGHAYGMVHASSRGERIPSSTSPTVRTDGRPVANLGIGPNGIQHPSPGQRTGEANWQTSGRLCCYQRGVRFAWPSSNHLPPGSLECKVTFERPSDNNIPKKVVWYVTDIFKRALVYAYL